MERKQEKILVAEDNEKLAALLVRKLANAGYEVFLVANGREALNHIRTSLPDLIILDILMPEMDGYEVKKALSENELTENIPVIFLTGKNDLQDKVKGLSLGADDYITKPFKQEELLARVEAILRRKRYYEYIAMHDGLTRLYNLTYFQKQFTQFFNMAERYATNFSLVILDVNKFKAINDTFGHKSGDLVLKFVAKIMQQRLRKSDILCRYGGDEFALLLPNTPATQATELAGRLITAIAETSIELEDKQTIHISVSYGVTEYCKEYENSDAMFNAADKLMYAYKKNPRIPSQRS